MTISAEPRRETDALLEWAEGHQLPDQIMTPDGMIHLRTRAGEAWTTTDPQRLAEQPRRARGDLSVHDASTFVQTIDLLKGTSATRNEGVGVYVDETTRRLVAVLNDDGGGEPGWRDHRVSLSLRRTPEWEAWVGGQGMKEQTVFAERMEDGEPEIIEPPAAVMLELAQTFHASTSAKFKSGQRLSSGERQLVFEENTDASAGADGTITIPEEFTLQVRPFVGSDPYRARARLRYRLNGGHLMLGYFLIRHEDIELDAFKAVVDKAREGLPALVFLNGPAPSTASA